MIVVMRRTVLAITLVCFVPSLAHAHLRMIEPASRYGDQQKQGPCGVAGGERADNVLTVEAGSELMLVWDEYINHPGHFRISFDDDGHDDFVDPAAFDDFNSGPSVMVDNIADSSTGGVYNYTITVPDVACDNCTLQIIQMMTDKPPYGDGNDIYYQCIDMIIEARDPNAPDAGGGMPPAMDTGVGGGCAVSSGGRGDAPLGVLLVLGVVASLVDRRTTAPAQ